MTQALVFQSNSHALSPVAPASEFLWIFPPFPLSFFTAQQGLHITSFPCQWMLWLKHKSNNKKCDQCRQKFRKQVDMLRSINMNSMVGKKREWPLWKLKRKLLSQIFSFHNCFHVIAQEIFAKNGQRKI